MTARSFDVTHPDTGQTWRITARELTLDDLTALDSLDNPKPEAAIALLRSIVTDVTVDGTQTSIGALPARLLAAVLQGAVNVDPLDGQR